MVHGDDGAMTRRLTAFLTHPVQYYVPWFRYVTERCSDVRLSVVYVSAPSAAQQGVGFNRPFTWDVDLLSGYRSHVLRPAREGDAFDSDHFLGLDDRGIAAAIREERPDAVLLAGWHSIAQVRALAACRRQGIPVIYRGDTHRWTGAGGWRWPGRPMKTRILLRQFAAHLAVGLRSREFLLAHGVPPTRIYHSPHVVDNAFFAAAAAAHQTVDGRAAARAGFGLGVSDFVVLFAGKLEARKRPLDAVRAVARLGAGASLLVAGDGPLAADCRREAARLDVRAVWAGFTNQREMGKVYGIADCLVLPSDRLESWGLVVNEAMATGLPAVVSDRAGCAPDLVDAETGAVVPAGDVEAIAAALIRIRAAGREADYAGRCRTRVARCSFERATTGLRAALDAVAPARAAGERPPRVIACCGSMVIVSGLERMTFEVLRVLRHRGASVHCIVNTWENHRIVERVEALGASWSTGYYRYGFGRRLLNPLRLAQFLWDMLRTSVGLLRDAARFEPTHVLVPEHTVALRNAPALLMLRLLDVAVVFRLANRPDRGRFYRFLWSLVLPRVVTTFVANSAFSEGRMLENGVPPAKIRLIRNTVSRRAAPAQTDAAVLQLVRERPTILSVGQLLPFKGTHFVVDAAVELLRAGHDVQAVIVGAIPRWPADVAAYVSELRQRADRDGHGRIHFVGLRENVLEIMRASYVLAVPILGEETFGNVVLEAQSVGLPAVAFPTGGLVELIAHGRTGLVSEAPTRDALVQGLEFYLRSPAERERASRACLQEFSRPDSDLTAGEFERRWWELFAQVSP
jgi:glycosyltransferase involved in cell wall biosynthesis